jgi:hypothetical protein
MAPDLTPRAPRTLTAAATPAPRTPAEAGALDRTLQAGAEVPPARALQARRPRQVHRVPAAQAMAGRSSSPSIDVKNGSARGGAVLAFAAA